MIDVTNQQFKIRWVDHHRKPQAAPDPNYPNGRDIRFTSDKNVNTCIVQLKYPTAGCGVYMIKCKICGLTIALTTAGRPDDPRTVQLPCEIKGVRQ
jgi:hypothetical protein